MPKFQLRRADGTVWLILAHGAGAGMDSEFLKRMTDLLVDRGVNVARFEFGYMEARRHGVARRPPPKVSALTTEYVAAISEFFDRILSDEGRSSHIFIGGKSMGGRVASMIADSAFGQKNISGCVCFGYPLHPSGKPETVRAAHLTNLICPLLMVQGERDPLGKRCEFAELQLSDVIEFAWMTDGDHDLKPRRASGVTHTENLVHAADAVATFVLSHARSGRRNAV